MYTVFLSSPPEYQCGKQREALAKKNCLFHRTFAHRHSRHHRIQIQDSDMGNLTRCVSRINGYNDVEAPALKLNII
jgi:hypothetical protein